MKKKYFVWLLAGCMAVTVPNAVLAAENVEEARREAAQLLTMLGNEAIHSFSGYGGNGGAGGRYLQFSVDVRGRSAESSHDL